MAIRLGVPLTMGVGQGLFSRARCREDRAFAQLFGLFNLYLGDGEKVYFFRNARGSPSQDDSFGVKGNIKSLSSCLRSDTFCAVRLLVVAGKALCERWRLDDG